MPPQDTSKTSAFPTPPTMEEVPAPSGGVYSPAKSAPGASLPGNPSSTMPPAPVLETNRNTPPTPTGQETTSTVVPPPPKKAFPKKILFIILGLVIVVVLIFVIKSLLGKTTKTQITEVTWWGLWEDETIIAPLIEEYQTANPNIKITYVKNSPQDYRERLTNALAKGTGPDIFRFHNTWVPMFSSELDNVPASVIGGGEYAQTFYPVITSDLTSGTGLVGVPLGYDALTLFINEDIFAQAGVEPPTTWVEMRERALQLTKKENNMIIQAGVALGRTENVDHWPEILGLMMIQNGVSLTNPTGQLAENALTFFTLFAKTDGVWDETLPPSTTAFAGGKLAMYFGPSWRAFNIREQNPDLKFKTVPLPQLPKEDPNEPDVSYATYWAEGVWARSKNKTAAWNFLKFLISKDNLGKLYQTASASRGFGEAYPRVDMKDLLLDHAVLGSIIKLAPYAESWYLASRTFDGETGINTQINKYFEDAINGINEGKQADKVMEPVTSGVRQVLSQYGLVK